MSTTATKNRKPTAYENYWQEIITILSYGEPVIIRGYSRGSIVKGLTDAKLSLSSEGKRSYENGINTRVLGDGGIRVSPRQWPFRKLSDEQRQTLEHFAASDMPQIFLPGLAVMDVEGLLQELSSLYAAQLRGEYAVHHLPGGVTDRACWVCKGGV
jgi:hypothetical protein